MHFLNLSRSGRLACHRPTAFLLSRTSPFAVGRHLVRRFYLIGLFDQPAKQRELPRLKRVRHVPQLALESRTLKDSAIESTIALFSFQYARALRFIASISESENSRHFFVSWNWQPILM
ncbi:MAG: hypothetical protein IPN66_06145 [Candidatus Competibacteraceae bacterium]|nr:hypothetical protein [Candidatus Competibacteraceae bacterium]